MPSSVVILRNEKSRQPASQCKSSILTIFIGVPFQSKPIEPGHHVVKDRGLLAFIEVSDGVPECPVYQRLRTIIMDFQSDPVNLRNTPLCLNPASTSKVTTHLMTADTTTRPERAAEA